MDASAESGNGEIHNVEVRYAGVVVGRAALVKELGPDAAFVGLSEPLPVGTRVTLKIGDEVREARVDEVVESAEPTVVGMRIRWGGAAPAARPVPVSSPAPAPAAARPPVAVAAPPPAEVAAPPPAEVAAPPPAEVAAPPPAEAAARPPAEVVAPPAAVPTGDEGSAAIAAPLSLASPAGNGAQPGGGKRRRKRR